MTDVIAVAEVSRNAFYRQFTSVDHCIEIALTEFDERVRQALDEALTDSRSTAASRFEQALSALVRIAAQAPDAFRAWVTDDFARPTGQRRIAELRARLAPVAGEALSASGRAVPAEMVTAIVGGLVLTLQSRASEGQAASLPALLPELLGWALSYRPPSSTLPVAMPAAETRQPDPARESIGAPERILLATTEMVAERGYENVRVKDLAARARVSLRTFYGHFDGLEQAFLSAVELHERRLLRAAFAAYRAQPSWPLAIDASLRALCDGLASEPHVARISGVGAHEGGPSTRDRLPRTLAALQAFLRAGYRHHPATRQFASEGIAAALAFTFHDHARSGRTHLIRDFAPTATFLALSPFLPIAHATLIARHSGGDGLSAAGAPAARAGAPPARPACAP